MSHSARQNQASEEHIEAGLTGPGEYRPAGEAQGQAERFTADQVAAAFNVAIERVHRAFDGEFQLGPGGQVDSRQAQQLAEAILGDQPLDVQQAALMELGAFTPRSDHDWGAGETPPEEESDLLRPIPNVSSPEAPRSGVDEEPRREDR